MDVLDHSQQLPRTKDIVYLYGAINHTERERIGNLEDKGFLFVQETPLNSGSPNYNILEPLLKIYHDDGMDIYELLAELGIQFLGSNIRKIRRVYNKLKQYNIRGALDLYSKIVERALNEDEENKFEESLDNKWKVYFQKKKPQKQIMTIHRAKGLEFDHVYVDSSSFFRFSNFREQLHYVAITRAKESLTINYNTMYTDKLREIGLLHWIT